MPARLLSVRGITKSFGTNAVLKKINLDLDGGEVLALIGGNGAGKSTLMKIIMGIYQPDDGKIYINGVLTNLNNASAALSAGIYMVPQEPMLFQTDDGRKTSHGLKDASTASRAPKSVMEKLLEVRSNPAGKTLSIANKRWSRLFADSAHAKI